MKDKDLREALSDKGILTLRDGKVVKLTAEPRPLQMELWRVTVDRKCSHLLMEIDLLKLEDQNMSDEIVELREKIEALTEALGYEIEKEPEQFVAIKRKTNK